LSKEKKRLTKKAFLEKHFFETFSKKTLFISNPKKALLKKSFFKKTFFCNLFGKNFISTHKKPA